MSMDGNKSFQAGGFAAGIQENSAEITIGQAAIASLPLTRASRNFSFGRRDGLTSRYGIAPIPGHDTGEASRTTQYPSETAQTPTSFGGLISSERTEVHTLDTVALGADYYDQRKAVLGILDVTVDLSPTSIRTAALSNVGSIPRRGNRVVPYWVTTRTQKSTYVSGNFRYDLCPPINFITGTGNQYIRASCLEFPIGHCNAVTNMYGYGGTPANFYTTYEQRRVEQLNRTVANMNIGGLIDYLTFSNASPTNTVWFMRFCKTKKDLQYINKEFVIQASQATNVVKTVVDPTTVNIAVSSTKLDIYGYPPSFINKEISNQQVNINLFAYGRGGQHNAAPTYSGYAQTVFLNTLSNEFNAKYRNYEYGDGNAIVAAGYYRPTSTFPSIFSFNSNVTVLNSAPSSTGVNYWSAKTDEVKSAVQGQFFFSALGGKASGALFIDRFRNPARRASSDYNDASTTWYGANPDTGAATVIDDSCIYVDPCFNEFKPEAVDTTMNVPNPSGSVVDYTVDGAEKRTCWKYFQFFPTGADSAVVQKDTEYEITYAIYNSLTGKLSNVGSPVRSTFVSAATPDTAAVSLAGTDFINRATYTADTPTPGFFQAKIPFKDRWQKHINHLKYVFYYREYGSFEWLFAGDFDAARLFNNVTIAGAGIVNDQYILLNPGYGQVGGQPGGYNDYSDLENDFYIDVASFQGRVFWCSKTTIRYSMKTDVLSFPLRNSVSVETGELRGILPHFFQGQAEQNGRLLIFTSDGYMEGRFTGNLAEQAIQVSLTSDPVVVPIDGSDFTVSQRSTEVSFSSRTAVVAEGVVYFMGPRGIFRDDGVQVPQRISQAIEPFFFDIMDPNKTDQFFAHYNARTREILFYFRPVLDTSLNQNSALTMAWVYSIRTESWSQGVPGAFTLYEYDCTVDWAQDIDTTQFEYATKRAGMRTVIGVRQSESATVSRAYYHDEDCSAGDMTAGREFVIKDVYHLVSGTLRLQLASGFSTAALTSVVAGTTKVAIIDAQEYRRDVEIANYDFYPYNPAAATTEQGLLASFLSRWNALNGIHLVTAKGADWIEIARPAGFTPAPVSVGAQLPAYTPGQGVPCYIEGFHDINAVIDTNYLAPEGLEGFHQFRKFHALMEPVPQGGGSQEPRVTMTWGAPHEFPTTTIGKTFPITPLNARERTTQVVVDLYNTQMSSQGQALRLNLTYPQIYGRFTLYWFSVDYNDIGNENLMMYQRANS